MTSTPSAPPRTSRPSLPRPRFRLPLLGDLLTINPAKPTQTSLKDAQRLGPIFERMIVNYPMIVVSGPQLIAEVNDDATWTKHVGVLFKKLRPIARDGLFTAYNYEPNWQKAHNVLAPGFTQEAMRSYHGTMLATLRELVDYWDYRIDGWVDVPEDMNKFTLEVMARTGFGYTFDSFQRSGDHPFVEAMMRGLTYINRNANLPPILQKSIGYRQRAQHERDKRYVKDVVDDVVARRKAGVRVEANATAGSDLLERMLSQPDPDSGEPLDEINIRNQILTFLVAGHETSAGVLAFALHFLATRPEIADRARHEIDAKWPATAERPEFAYEDVARLRYLRRVVDETLRLWPIAPGYFREAKEDTVIGDGAYPFKKGEWVFVLTLAAHRDSVWGSDADDFDPDRFLPERLRALDRSYVYKPFGTGMRACIGRQFAYHEVLLALATLLRRYEFEPDPSFRLDQNISEQITLKPTGLRLRIRRRDLGEQSSQSG
ncbi:cytochrome P450 [Aldersonia sp. NBC_00410]|uniref:cytochrome P450 n=1 Tax=Aldersonia sp. NBC_00410 TaxID=2975954 RepID=UPI002258B7C7|nr:cytochrome P450 [Aldersonia sp. NBC_00410]MCX5042514.1 cytochrome P450 [Aldersonia sp. NBC_00410]